MVDIGLYNFVKKAVEDGKSRDTIQATLLHAGWKEEEISQAIDHVEKKAPPSVASPATVVPGIDPLHDTRLAEESKYSKYLGQRPTLITVLCGYYFITWLLFIVNFIVFQVGLYIHAQSVSWSFNVHNWEQGMNLAIAAIFVIGVLGYWSMKKWGVYLYVCAAAGAAAFVLLKISTFTNDVILSLVTLAVIPLVMIIAGLRYYPYMGNF